MRNDSGALSARLPPGGLRYLWFWVGFSKVRLGIALEIVVIDGPRTRIFLDFGIRAERARARWYRVSRSRLFMEIPGNGNLRNGVVLCCKIV